MRIETVIVAMKGVEAMKMTIDGAVIRGTVRGRVVIGRSGGDQPTGSVTIQVHRESFCLPH